MNISIERSYDKHGLIVSLRSSLSAQLNYERNAYGELVCFRASEAETNASFTSDHQYDSLGFELERLLPGGVSQSFAYDNIGRLVDSKTRRSAEQRRSRHYNWGSADRLLSIEDDRYGLTQYSYSPSGELTMATYADGTKEYRLSDKVGNLYNDPDKKLRKYLEGGRIEKSGEWTFKYDKDGQLIEKFRGKAGFSGAKKDRWEYSWTQNGMLEGVLSPHRYGQWTRFTYDALGRRLTKLGDATFHYQWNGNVPLHEWRTGERYEDGGLKSYSEDLKTWLFEEESFVPLALIQEGKAYSIVCDQLGTPTEAYDEEGREVWYRRLDMNGKILEETQPGLNPEGHVSIPFLFQGQYYDHETGLAYNRFRYYDPELGRYISQDPIGLASGVLAFYSYVQNPLVWGDIWGLDWVYQIVGKDNIVKYYGITERDPAVRMAEHIQSGKLQPGERMQIVAKDVNHDQARTIEAQLIRGRIAESGATNNLSVKEKLEYAGLRNKNRGRDIEKRPFNAKTMGGEYSLLDSPEDVNSEYKTRKSYKK